LVLTTGQFNTMFGTNAGVHATTSSFNAFFGGGAGLATTTGGSNVFFGNGAGANNTTGNNNIHIGVSAGFKADPAASNNIYIGTQASGGESNTVRLGDPATQSATYIAGVNGAPTAGGIPVFIDSTGKLGTGGGSVSFTQVAGTLTSPQLTGTYNNQVTMSNPTNVFSGGFTGNGSGLTGVASGLAWPIVTKSADYTVQLSDFSTTTTEGKFLILTGAVTHTFTLPNPAPPNGSCVAIGNLADAGLNSNANAFLKVVPASPLTVDSDAALVPSQARRTSYLYCSDGNNYFRLGYQQNGVNEIGPWIKTYDTGTVNVMQTTFRNGMDFGVVDGSMIYLLPKFANTSNIVTLTVNGSTPFKILKYGNQGLAPGDLSPNAYAALIFNVNGTKWELINPQTPQFFTGTTPSIGGSALTAGSCATGATTVTGAAVGRPVGVSASDGSLPDPSIILSAAVTATNTITVQLCAVAGVTPAAKSYIVSTQ
jgi:hypothetical protein